MHDVRSPTIRLLPLPRSRAERGYPLNGDTFVSLGAEFHTHRMPQLVNALVARKVDVMIAVGYPAALAAKQGKADGSLDQRRSDYFRLLQQVPALTELSELDGEGKEQVKISRLDMDVVDSKQDFSGDPRFTDAMTHKRWFSPVYLRKKPSRTSPYRSSAPAGADVTVAEVNLKLIWDVISSVMIGERGYAYVVDRDGRLIAQHGLQPPSLRGRKFARQHRVQQHADRCDYRDRLLWQTRSDRACGSHCVGLAGLRCAADGCGGYMAKPISPRLLLGKVRECIGLT
jgi:hypothetical protein